MIYVFVCFATKEGPFGAKIACFTEHDSCFVLYPVCKHGSELPLYQFCTAFHSRDSESKLNYVSHCSLGEDSYT